MPVFPIVAAVTNPKLAGNARITHCLVKLDIHVKQHIIVATVHKPTDSAQCLLLSVVGATHKICRTMLPDRVIENVHLLLSVRGKSAIGIQRHQCAHGIDGTEHVGMPLGINRAAASAHGKSADDGSGQR